MSFQIKFMLKMGYKSLFATRGTDARLTSKRIKIIIFMTPWYLITLLINWICLWLDEIFFRSYHRQKVGRPLFIVGPPRSGTTFLHRLLARDSQFTSMKTWEILFAPSIIQKKFWKVAGLVDDVLGSPVQNGVKKLEKKLLKKFNVMHKVSIFEPEEDEAVLINIFASYFIGLVVPFADDFRPFVHFDDELPAEVRRNIMTFYKKCIQRHLYVYGKNKYYLSKNPSFSSRVESINEMFPDSRVICTVRTPMETVPSTFSLYTFSFKIFNSPIDDSRINSYIIDLLSHWYRHPLCRLTHWHDERYAILEYSELVRDPMESLLRIYERIGYDVCHKTYEILNEEKEKACGYKSRHAYNFEKSNMTGNQIAAEFIDICQQFSFNTVELVNS